jgi:PTH1 family peptidyl-tRNA hydrolase
MSIKLVAGLGNPGRTYANTRHNLGWVVLDAFAGKRKLAWRNEPAFEAMLARWDSPSGAVWLAKPLTFMNDSGFAVGAIARFHKLEIAEVCAIHDDLNIEIGRVKVSVTGSAGGHNGVASLLEHLGDGFVRYRLGIGPKEPKEMDMKDFVLSKFSSEQLVIIDQKLDLYVQGLELLLESGADRAMNQINRKEES